MGREPESQEIARVLYPTSEPESTLPTEAGGRELSEAEEELPPGLLPPERIIATARFGLLDAYPRTLAEVAEILGVPLERVRRIDALVLKRMRETPLT